MVSDNLHPLSAVKVYCSFGPRSIGIVIGRKRAADTSEFTEIASRRRPGKRFIKKKSSLVKMEVG